MHRIDSTQLKGKSCVFENRHTQFPFYLRSSATRTYGTISLTDFTYTYIGFTFKEYKIWSTAYPIALDI